MLRVLKRIETVRLDTPVFCCFSGILPVPEQFVVWPKRTDRMRHVFVACELGCNRAWIGLRAAAVVRWLAIAPRTSDSSRGSHGILPRAKWQ